MSASIQGSSVHSVSARVTVSSGGPWYPDASAVPMAATLPPGTGGTDRPPLPLVFLAAAGAGLDGADGQGLDRFGAALRGAGEEDAEGLVGRVDPQVCRLGRAAGGGREVQRVHDLQQGVGGRAGGQRDRLHRRGAAR